MGVIRSYLCYGCSHTLLPLLWVQHAYLCVVGVAHTASVGIAHTASVGVARTAGVGVARTAGVGVARAAGVGIARAAGVGMARAALLRHTQHCRRCSTRSSVVGAAHAALA